MKKNAAVFLVFAIVIALGFAGYWIGRTGSPVAQSKSPMAAPSVTQSKISAPSPAASPIASVPEPDKRSPKILQSTYVPQGGSSDQQSAAAPAPPSKNGDPPSRNGKPAAELIAAIENDDTKSAFPNPAIAAHQALLNEQSDPDWSQQAEQQLRDFLSAQLGNRFEYPLVQCGTDICEIQAASFVDGDSAADLRDFQRADSDMQLQPWWTTLQFDELTFQVQSSKNGRHLIIVFITRK